MKIKKNISILFCIAILPILFLIFYLWTQKEHFMDIAAINGKLSIVKVLSSLGVNLDNKKSGNGWTPLMYSSRSGHFNVVEFLIENGADVNFPNPSGKTPLMLACHSGHTKVAKYLLEKGSELNRKDKWGMTAFLYASSNPTPNTMIFLLDKGVNVNQQDVGGQTALKISINNLRIKNIKALIEHGADINILDKKGKTALDYAIENARTDYTLKEDKNTAQEIIKLLKSHGAKTRAELKAEPKPSTEQKQPTAK